jgi:glucokinase
MCSQETIPLNSVDRAIPPDTRFVVGVDIGGTKVAIGSMLLDGTRLLTRRLPTHADDGADAVMARVLEAAHALAAETCESRPLTLAGLAVSSPGVIQDEGILLAPNNPGWETLPLRRRLEQSFPGLPVAVLNDVRAAALAEARSGAMAGARTGLYLNLGTGLSAAVVLNGVPLEGAHGAAGEIAYQLTGRHTTPAYAEGHAPLEEQASGQGIADSASALLGRPLTTAEVFAGARTDARLRQLIDDAFDTVAVHVANLAVALDPDWIVFGGGFLPHTGDLVDRVREVVSRATPFPPEVCTADLVEDGALLGALLLASDVAGD